MRRWQSIDPSWLGEAVIVLVMAAAMALPTLLWQLQKSLDEALTARGGGAIVLFLQHDSPVVMSRLQGQLRNRAIVQSVDMHDAQQARAEFSSFLGLKPDAPAMAEITIPPSLTVSLISDAEVGAVNTELRQWQSWPEISSVYWSQAEIEQRGNLYRLLRKFGFGLTWVLLFAGLAVIAASVAGRMAQQRANMVVMTLLGAPFGFILRPFLIHALLLGVLAAALAALLLSAGLAGLQAPLESLQSSLGAPIPMPALGTGTLALLFFGGPLLSGGTTAWIVHRQLDQVSI